MQTNDPSPSLIGRLEQEHTQHLQTSAAEEITRLRAMLQEIGPLPERVDIFSRSMAAPIMAFLSAPFIALFALLMIAISVSEGIVGLLEAGNLVALGVGLLMAVASVGVVYMAINLIRHSNRPVATLLPTGIAGFTLARPVPWEAVVGCSIAEIRYLFDQSIITFQLKKGYQIEWSAGQLWKKKMWMLPKDKFVIGGLSLHPKAKEIAAHIENYRSQYRVQKRLAELEG